MGCVRHRLGHTAVTDEAEMVRLQRKRDRALWYRAHAIGNDRPSPPRASLSHPLPTSVLYVTDRP
jgi:hypothetical protein